MADNSWEDEGNLEHAKDLLKAYHRSQVRTAPQLETHTVITCRRVALTEPLLWPTTEVHDRPETKMEEGSQEVCHRYHDLPTICKSSTPSSGIGPRDLLLAEPMAGLTSSTLPRISRTSTTNISTSPRISYAWRGRCTDRGETSENSSTGLSTDWPPPHPRGSDTPSTTSRIESTLHQIDPRTPLDLPGYSPMMNTAESQARSILWQVIEYYFGSLPCLSLPDEQELERRQNVFLVWEAMGDVNHLHARQVLGLPQHTTTEAIVQRLFLELHQSRSLPTRSTSELQGNTSATPPPYPDGPFRTSSERTTMNSTGGTSTSEISLPSGYQRGPLPNNCADSVGQTPTGSSTVQTIFAGLVASINQVIDRVNAAPIRPAELQRPLPSAGMETSIMNRIPRPSSRDDH
ncbi:hypothetical protein WOLCODRAFT_149758 [Wolfiporia cocos MD-104 SS10]|uniref:Uncharacterized protein n=1 Tax=Wolfiporia cocos (strain MD-104) TaxID=742152 RepID=A0A2H3JUA9_WOLCO|nr:hypothetical protein WOLCODRAFT_149758 [Wolfiporia cocos MD-104 SS10]